MLLTYISFAICFLYFILILLFIIGWKRISVFVPTGGESKILSVSVVVVCKNEEEHLRRLLSCLAQQSYQDFELVLVNDHSIDATLQIMRNAESAFSKIQIIDSVGNGKKAAMKEAVESANGHLVITTDGDCLPSFHWIESITCYYRKNPCDLMICPIRLTSKETLFSQLQSLEFASLVASGAAAAGIGMPILCNGANLAFKKNTWLKNQENLHEEEQSGDDIFLLQSIKKQGGKIRFLKSESAFVYTEPAQSLDAFIKQRQRWAAKSPTYTDWQLIFTACIVLAISLLPFVLVGFSFQDDKFWNVLLFVTVFKYLMDGLFLYSVRVFFQLQYVLFYALLLSIIYPFYIVFTALSALLYKPKTWK